MSESKITHVQCDGLVSKRRQSEQENSESAQEPIEFHRLNLKNKWRKFQRGSFLTFTEKEFREI